MDFTLQEKAKLIEFFEFLLNNEIDKPLGEMNSEAVDSYIKILLFLQGKNIELSSEFIDEQVRKIFHKEDETTVIPDTVKTKKNYFNKKKVWLVAACIAILVALFSFVSVAYDWNVFDFLTEKFGSVHSTPIGEEQEINGITVVMNGKTTTYSTIQDALKTEKLDVLYPTVLPKELQLKEITFYNESIYDKISYTFVDKSLIFEITLDNEIDDNIKSVSNEILEINDIKCFVCEMADINIYQIEFEYKGNTYYLSHADKDLLVKIIENLEEINNEN